MRLSQWSLLALAILAGGWLAVSGAPEGDVAGEAGDAVDVAADAEEEEAGSAAAEAPPEPDEGASLQVVYIPPSRGAANVRVGGGTRGVEAVSLAALAPDHVGLTRRAQPSLGWFASADTGTARVDFTLMREDETEPRAEVSLAGPFGAGIHFVDLADLDVRLEPGATYEWSVSLVIDPEKRDRDVVAGGTLQLVEGAREGSASYVALARQGIWYDDIAVLSDAIEGDAADAVLRRDRAGLLEQIGLDQVAAHDRGQLDD